MMYYAFLALDAYAICQIVAFSISPSFPAFQAFNSSVSGGGNVTTSFVRYTPAASHHGHTLTCRGANEELFTSATQIVEDHRALQIYCESRRSNQIRWSFQQGETENC